MAKDSFVISLPRKCVGKSSPSSLLYDKSHDSLNWHTPDPRVSPMNLVASNLILDPVVKMRKTFPNLMWTSKSILVPTDCPQKVYEHYEQYTHCELPLDVQHVSSYTGDLRPKLTGEVQHILSGLVNYAQVCITVTSSFILHIYGTKPAVDYAQYKLFVALNHLYNYSIMKLELPLAKQPLVAGPDRQHLLTIFQQTGINVYMPPPLNPPPKVSVDEIFLAGEKVQLVLAEKLLREVVVRKTDTLEKECVVSSFVNDTLSTHCATQLSEIMLKNATFIQLPSLGSTDACVRVMGTTRRSIDNTIDQLMRLCGSVYCMEVKAHIDDQLSAQIAATGVSVMSTTSGTVIYGLDTDIKQALKALKAAGSDGVTISVLIEQPLELMDFIIGKKQGKILKVVHGTGTTITVEKFHEQNFRLRLSGDKASFVLDALTLLEDELPAEKSLYIPEVYHKQVIGQGGLSIQTLMRKYNVYMRFANTTKEKYPNAFGDSRSDNVIIRCPAKNSAKIDAAAQELMDYVAQLAQNHCRRCVRLTRNHRRMLLETHSNGLREIEVSSGAAIKLPSEESKETQLVEVSGQTEASTEVAINMLRQLLSQTDYEFRFPWSQQFLEAVGPKSKFSTEVCTPLFLAMSAQVQAFEKVQMTGDPTIYSQIVVSVQENDEGELFDDISQVVTTYLRRYHIDIVDKGKLNTELQVESDIPTLGASSNSDAVATNAVANAVATTTTTNNNKIQKQFTANTAGVAAAAQTLAYDTGMRLSRSSIYQSPQQHEAQISLDFLRNQAHTARLDSVTNVCDVPVSVPKETPLGLPSRPPMSAMQWNRNFDDTPVKKRGLENEDEFSGRVQTERVRSRPRFARFNRQI